jgi:hypothetical protein
MPLSGIASTPSFLIATGTYAFHPIRTGSKNRQVLKQVPIINKMSISGFALSCSFFLISYFLPWPYSNFDMFRIAVGLKKKPYGANTH